MSFYAVHPARPASEVEWEDALLRWEIAPRALRVALGDGDAAGPARQRVEDLLRALVFNELWTSRLFSAMRSGLPVSETPRVEALPADAEALYARFERLRERNFNELQRRGIDVWQWRTEAPAHGTATAYQLVLASIDLDVRTLAEVRQALRGAAV